MSLARYTDWPERLNQFFCEAQSKRFVRGKWDCALFAVGAAIAMTGKDFGEGFRGKYKTPSGATDLLKVNGHPDLQSLATSVLGEPLRGVLMAQRGDVVLFETPEGQALGIVDLSGTQFCAVSQKGLSRIPLHTALLAWRL